MSFKRKLDTVPLTEAWDMAIDAGVGNPDMVEGAAALARLRDSPETNEAYLRLDDWRGGAFERIVQCWENGTEIAQEDADALSELHAMAVQAAKLKS